MSEQVRVMLIDDHMLFRKGLAELLEGRGGIHIVAAIGNPEEALRNVDEHQPDIILVDLNMPPHGGLRVLRDIQDSGWRGSTIVLTVSDAEDDLANAMRSGARGYLLKDMEPSDVVDAILRVANGEMVVAPAMTPKLVSLLQGGSSRQSPRDGMLSQLTARERQIFDYLAQGLSNKAIARELNISHDTVKLHVHHILTKLNFTSRVDAVMFAAGNREAGQ